MRRTIALLLPLAILLLALARPSSATTDAFKIIVHPDNPMTSVDREFIRRAFLRKTLEWGNGKGIRPVDLTQPANVRERFTREVLKKTPSQLRSYWTQQIFSGKGAPPDARDSVEAVIAYVLENPGAVGYLPAETKHGRAKVVTLQ